jgi:plasmid stability protein
MELAMGDLSIKDVPEHQIALLRARAGRNHRSLQGELRAILDEALAAPRKTITIEELVENGRRLGLKTPSESVRIIRELRDR